MTNCRIGKVTPKLSIVEPRKRGEHQQTLIDHATQIASYYPDGIAAFAVVAIGFDGKFSRGMRVDEESHLGVTVFVAACSEILRRDIGAEVTKEVLRGEA